MPLFKKKKLKITKFFLRTCEKPHPTLHQLQLSKTLMSFQVSVKEDILSPGSEFFKNSQEMEQACNFSSSDATGRSACPSGFAILKVYFVLFLFSDHFHNSGTEGIRMKNTNSSTKSYTAIFELPIWFSGQAAFTKWRVSIYTEENSSVSGGD